MQSWGLQPAELGFLLQPLRQAWQAVGTSWRLEWFRLRVVQGPGMGEPSASPYCPLIHCLVHTLCSRDREEQCENMIPGLLFLGLAPCSSMTLGEYPPGVGVGVGRLWRVALSGTTGIPPSLITISLATAAVTLLQFFFFFFFAF